MTERLIESGPLYQKLAQEFAALIRDGHLKPGERLPSVRRLAMQRQISVSTALQALRSLENSELVEARPQSGYFVRRRARALEEPAITLPPQAPRYVGIAAWSRGFAPLRSIRRSFPWAPRARPPSCFRRNASSGSPPAWRGASRSS